jgi:hypothetical protein
MAHTASPEGDSFVGKTDLYRGVTVVAAEEPCHGQHFEAKLQRTLQNWEQQVQRRKRHQIAKAPNIALYT